MSFLIKSKLVLGGALSLRDIKLILDYRLNKRCGFMFNSEKLSYFFHSYNNFRLTERAIEIPIIKFFLQKGNYENVLEIGNVANYYYEFFKEVFKKKTVVDKYEYAYDIIQKDICQYVPTTRFDFVMSISTFEHMDSDLGRNPEYTKGKSKLISIAADNIKYVSDYLLKEGGKFVLTAPLSYTPEWDATFFSDVFNKCNFIGHKAYVFKKISELTWLQIDMDEAKRIPFNYQLPWVNYLSVVEFWK